MKDRIQRFLQSENKSYAQFAEEIGVQASGISHILSGRNNPSLDFVVKMLTKYPALSSEWLLFGRGSMYKTISQPTLFDDEPAAESAFQAEPREMVQAGDSGAVNAAMAEQPSSFTPPAEASASGSRKLEKVLLIFSDKTFEVYNPF